MSQVVPSISPSREWTSSRVSTTGRRTGFLAATSPSTRAISIPSTDR